jgi:hypothetical protein
LRHTTVRVLLAEASVAPQQRPAAYSPVNLPFIRGCELSWPDTDIPSCERRRYSKHTIPILAEKWRIEPVAPRAPRILGCNAVRNVKNVPHIFRLFGKWRSCPVAQPTIASRRRFSKVYDPGSVLTVDDGDHARSNPRRNASRRNIHLLSARRHQHARSSRPRVSHIRIHGKQ